MNSIRLHFALHALFSALVLFWMTGCGQGENNQESAAESGKITLTVWAHHGKPEEWKTIQAQVQRFSETQDKIKVDLVEIAEGSYDTQVQSAAASDKLPDVLEFDGPNLANYAWKGILVPIEGMVSQELQNDLLPSIIMQGTYNDKLYALGAFDSGLGLYGNRQMLQEAGARIPEGYQDAWTVQELNEILASLSEKRQEKANDKYAIDIKRDQAAGEWWTYGFYPALVSGDAGLINRDNYQTADGVLNSEDAVKVMEHFQNWAEKGLIDPNTDGRAFLDRRVAISWVGHWEFPRYHEELGEDLVLMPLPDYGNGTRTAMGSWCWGITQACSNRKAAMQFIEFLLQPQEILAITKANGAVPAREAAIEQSPNYSESGPLHLFVVQLRNCAVPRPRTPAYPVITSAFQNAMLAILTGADVQSELNDAVVVIDRDIKENEGYPVIER